jgi:hypothetical protein
MSPDFNVPILQEVKGKDALMITALGSHLLIEVIFRPGAVDDSAWGHQSDPRYPIDNYAGLRDIPK